MDNHTEPQLKWTRIAAFLALFHAFIYSLTHEITTGTDPVLLFDFGVVCLWALGGNGRALVVDAIRHWKGGK